MSILYGHADDTIRLGRRLLFPPHLVRLALYCLAARLHPLPEGLQSRAQLRWDRRGEIMSKAIHVDLDVGRGLALKCGEGALIQSMPPGRPSSCSIGRTFEGEQDVSWYC